MIKNNGKPWKDHVDEIVKCFKFPLEIRIDFYCLTESLTRFALIVLNHFKSFFRPDDLLYASSGTSFNETKIIENDKHLDNLLEEVTDSPNEKILEAHYSARLRDATSGIVIRDILAMKLFVKRFQYESSYQFF